ncbi:MAG: nitronate monooxygenase [Rickettsiaceae bacterium]|jgi:NAD(P)H-dependent flavin oxidoreductase YrpB (nitropropane dioxygenase family)|nr:nitronate monooxygenase [Rickettsiaceae bacterium]
MRKPVLKTIKSLTISNKNCLPIIEGGKGIGITTGITAGSFAKAGAVGTFSGVNADYYDEKGNLVPVIYRGKTRKDKHEELVNYGINGGIAQARIAHDLSGGNGAIHMNVLWEMGGAERILHGVLEGAKGLIHGITCGAGMPYRLSEIAQKYGVHYYPIVSSMRAFRALWKRSYEKAADLLGGVVYECPWKAGGHNGLSNAEDPKVFQDPYPRVVEIRTFMNSVGLHNTPIIMAGGVWNIEEYESWLDNPEIGPIVFQFGTRPMLTKEYPISNAWKQRLLTLKKGDVYLNRFSPTGFYSSAVENDFIKELQGREIRQVEYRSKPEGEFNVEIPFGQRGRVVYVKAEDKPKVDSWIKNGFDEGMKTPDETLMFVDKSKAQQILTDQINCMGCLTQCRFSNWSQHEETNYNNGKKADPRSFCIQKTLQEIKDGMDIENQLMFAGHNAYRFASDPFYNNGFVPTIKELVDRIMTGK